MTKSVCLMSQITEVFLLLTIIITTYYYTGCLLWNCTMIVYYIIVYYARCLCFNARLTFRCCAPHTPPSNRRRWCDDRPLLCCGSTDCMLRSLCGSSSALNSAVVAETSPCTLRQTGPHSQRLNGSIGCGGTPAALSKPD